MVFAEIFFPLVMGVISLFLGAFFLMLSTKIFKTSNSNYPTALKATIFPLTFSTIMSVILNFISNASLSIFLWLFTFVVGLILGVWFVKINYLVGIGKALLILLVAFAIGIIPSIIIILILGLIASLIFVGSQLGSFFPRL